MLSSIPVAPEGLSVSAQTRVGSVPLGPASARHVCQPPAPMGSAAHRPLSPGVGRGRLCRKVLPRACPVRSLDRLESTHTPLRACRGLTPGLAVLRAQARKGLQSAYPCGDLWQPRRPENPLSGHTALVTKEESPAGPAWWAGFGPPFLPSARARMCLGGRTKPDCPPVPLLPGTQHEDVCQGWSRGRMSGRGGLTRARWPAPCCPQASPAGENCPAIVFNDGSRLL